MCYFSKNKNLLKSIGPEYEIVKLHNVLAFGYVKVDTMCRTLNRMLICGSIINRKGILIIEFS